MTEDAHTMNASEAKPGLWISIILALGFGSLGVWVGSTGDVVWAVGCAILALGWVVLAVLAWRRTRPRDVTT